MRGKILSLGLAAALLASVAANIVIRSADQPEPREMPAAELMALQISNDAPIRVGPVMIMGARHAMPEDILVIDMAPNWVDFEGLPEHLFQIYAEENLRCHKQSSEVVALNDSQHIRYRIFSRGGMVKSEIDMPVGHCTRLPITLPKAESRLPGIEFLPALSTL